MEKEKLFARSNKPARPTITLDKEAPLRISRKEFLRLMITGLGGLLGVAWLQACAPQPTAAPSPTLAPIATSQAETAAKAIRRPAIIKIYPASPSTVVRVRHAGVWSGKQLNPKSIREMLDASITKLTGLEDAKSAWQALFAPNEEIAIKVNAFSHSLIWTHAPLVEAITQSLIDAGIPADNMLVYDYGTSELEAAGFQVNEKGPGIRCYGLGMDSAHDELLSEGVSVSLTNILKKADAVINVPILKTHSLAGISFALKNHYGSVLTPAALHRVDRMLPALNALPDIKDKTRLVIGDILEACLMYSGGFPFWKSDYVGDTILMSFDPVAHDVVGMEIFKQLKADRGESTDAQQGLSAGWLAQCGKAGLGANEIQNIKLEEIKLG